MIGGKTMKKFLCILMILVILPFGAACQKEAEKKITIASKPMTEQFIIVEMLTKLIEDNTDIIVEQKMGIGGGTSNIHPAMLAGEIDIYPEYTGTGWLFVLKEELINDPELLYKNVKDSYMEKFDIKWLEPYGFNNTFALVMKKELADELEVKTYSDLAKVSDQLIFGAEYDFYEREDGMPGLRDLYDFNFKNEVEMDIGLKYDAIGNEKVDVINAFSTDGLLMEYNLVVLEDDKYFFPSYHGATLVRNETLKKYSELEEILNRLSGVISDEDMIRLNYLVDKENKDPKEVASEYLLEKGLIK